MFEYYTVEAFVATKNFEIFSEVRIVATNIVITDLFRVFETPESYSSTVFIGMNEVGDEFILDKTTILSVQYK